MKYAVQMGSDAMIYIPSFIKNGWGFQKLTQTEWKVGLEMTLFAIRTLKPNQCFVISFFTHSYFFPSPYSFHSGCPSVHSLSGTPTLLRQEPMKWVAEELHHLPETKTELQASSLSSLCQFVQFRRQDRLTSVWTLFTTSSFSNHNVSKTVSVSFIRCKEEIVTIFSQKHVWGHAINLSRQPYGRKVPVCSMRTLVGRFWFLLYVKRECINFNIIIFEPYPSNFCLMFKWMRGLHYI
jgi:hypothetical protein